MCEGGVADGSLIQDPVKMIRLTNATSSQDTDGQQVQDTDRQSCNMCPKHTLEGLLKFRAETICWLGVDIYLQQFVKIH